MDNKIFLKSKLYEFATKNLTPAKEKNKFNCPFCGGSDPLAIDPNHETFHCFSCGESGDIFRLYSKLNGVGFVEAKKALEGLYGVNESYIPPIKERSAMELEAELLERQHFCLEAHNNLFSSSSGIGYLRHRGLSDETINRFKLGFDAHFNASAEKGWSGWPCVIIPNGEGGFLARGISGKAFKQTQGPKGIFNRKVLKEECRAVVVCEAEFDALSVYEVAPNGIEAIATCGAENLDPLLKEIQNNSINKATVFVLAFDNDEAGAKATKRVESMLKAFSFSSCVLPINGAKDCNEWLLNDREGFKKALGECVNEALKPPFEGVSNLLEGLLKQAEEQTYISTGFPSIDAMLGGGFASKQAYYVIGGRSGVGKSALVLSIAENVAKQGRPVIFFSWEMTALEHVKRSIIKLSGGSITSQNFSDKLRAKDSELLRLIGEYKRVFGNNLIFIDTNTSNSENYRTPNIDRVESDVRAFIERTGLTPLVIVDYMQITRKEGEEDLRKAVKEVSYQLKQLANSCPVVVLSSVNRESYKKVPDLTAFKESGDVEYSANGAFVLTNTFYTNPNNEAKPLASKDEASKLSLVLVKGRDGGAGSQADFNYIGETYTFEEVKKTTRKESLPLQYTPTVEEIKRWKASKK